MTLLVYALIDGNFVALFTTLIYTVLFPVIVFILVNTAITMGLLMLSLAIVVFAFCSPFFAPENPAPTGFVLRDSSGSVVDEIDTYGNSRNYDRRYERTFGGDWRRIR